MGSEDGAFATNAVPQHLQARIIVQAILKTTRPCETRDAQLPGVEGEVHYRLGVPAYHTAAAVRREAVEDAKAGGTLADVGGGGGVERGETAEASVAGTLLVDSCYLVL